MSKMMEIRQKSVAIGRRKGYTISIRFGYRKVAEECEFDMKNTFVKSGTIAVILGVILTVCFIVPDMLVYGETDESTYYMGETQKKDDAGYKDDVEMKSSDIHAGWNLGQFCIAGWTDTATDENGNVIFLKNVGDKISLSFLLQQDIDALHDNSKWMIAEDDNGYDEHFGISKDQRTNFGRGALLIRQTDENNKVTFRPVYTDYLNGVQKGAQTSVEVFEEGDYEIALDYEIQNNRFHVKSWKPINTYSHYQILIRFSVRNGNCMFYPFDVTTGSELTNCAFTENGFRLDLAKSKYLKPVVKKENYVEDNGTFIEDTRFNRPAKDGEEFTEPGIYTITVSNPYTGSQTEKKIYVGTDPVLKAYVTTGQDIDKIKELISEGAVIEKDGTITLASNEIIPETEQATETMGTVENSKVSDSKKPEAEKEDKTNSFRIIGVIIIAELLLLIFVLIANRRKRKNTSSDEASMEDKE